METKIDRRISYSSSYEDKLIKLIPADIVAAFIALNGFLSSEIEKTKWILLAASLLLLLLIPIYLNKMYGVYNPAQILVTMGSFLVWVYSIGGPFVYFGWQNPYLAATILVFWTLLIPLINFEPEYKIGQTVKVKNTRQKPVIQNTGIIDWTTKHNKYLGKDATITKILPKIGAARLDIDSGENIWAFEWLRKGEKETSDAK